MSFQSISEWRATCRKAGRTLWTDHSVRRRVETAVPLLAPNQDIYLRENISLRLLVAAGSSAPSGRDLETVCGITFDAWVRAYYRSFDATKAHLDEVIKLSQQSILDGAENAAEPGVAGKLMQTRVRNLMASLLQRAARLRLPAAPAARCAVSNAAENLYSHC